jgi:hypothetical protein
MGGKPTMTGSNRAVRWGTGLLGGALAIALLATASPAPAATKPFYGVVPQTPLKPADYERMAKGKVGTIRIPFAWPSIDPARPAGDFNFAGIDEVVANAARNRIDVLPFLSGSPDWVAKGLDRRHCGGDCVRYAPSGKAALAAWREFVGATVARYGRKGSFWSEHPRVPRRPIEVWQIWNEQNSRSFFAPKAKPRAYAKLLRAASRAIKGRDRRAKIVLGGMPQLAGSRKATPGTRYLRGLYRIKGIAKRFDGVAVHPYGAKVGAVIDQVEAFREQIVDAHDGGASLWVTETGWSSARGANPLNVGARGQSSRLRGAFRYFRANRGRLNLESVDWFSWMDSPASICDWCAKSGLLRTGRRAKPAWRAFTGFTGGR